MYVAFKYFKIPFLWYCLFIFDIVIDLQHFSIPPTPLYSFKLSFKVIAPFSHCLLLHA